MSNFYYLLGTGIILIVIEMFTPSSFIFFSLGIGSIITSLFSFFIKDPKILIIIASICSIAVFFMIKKMEIFKQPDNYKSNLEMYLGKEGNVLQKLDTGLYRIKVFGEEWNVECENELNTGDRVVIKEITSDGMIVEKK